MEDILYDFWAASLQDGYIGRLIEIVSGAGGSRSLYEMGENQMLKMGLSPRMTKYIINRKNSFSIEKEYENMLRHEIRFIRHSDTEYPDRLRDIESAPYALFVKGNIPTDDVPSVAIVGSRECSEYGRNMAEYFGNRLARMGISIVSGMAYGIDGISQMAALDAGGSTYAVLGCGVDVVYPASNRRLYERIISEGGGIVSEYAPGTQARSRNFPPRNRIISGLSDVLLVVEARAKSGTLITADLAMDQGREVMIIPGRLTDPLSVGCVNLMKGGAFPALCIEDVIERLPNRFEKIKDFNNKKEINEYDNDINNRSNTNYYGLQGGGKMKNLTDDEKKVYACLDFYPHSVNEVAEGTSMSVSRLLIVLTEMEMKGLVRSIGQGAFVKTS